MPIFQTKLTKYFSNEVNQPQDLPINQTETEFGEGLLTTPSDCCNFFRLVIAFWVIVVGSCVGYLVIYILD